LLRDENWVGVGTRNIEKGKKRDEARTEAAAKGVPKEVFITGKNLALEGTRDWAGGGGSRPPVTRQESWHSDGGSECGVGGLTGAYNTPGSTAEGTDRRERVCKESPWLEGFPATSGWVKKGDYQGFPDGKATQGRRIAWDGEEDRGRPHNFTGGAGRSEIGIRLRRGVTGADSWSWPEARGQREEGKSLMERRVRQWDATGRGPRARGAGPLGGRGRGRDTGCRQWARVSLLRVALAGGVRCTRVKRAGGEGGEGGGGPGRSWGRGMGGGLSGGRGPPPRSGGGWSRSSSL